nr:hypothetical protein [Sphaerisporangium perillae]
MFAKGDVAQFISTPGGAVAIEKADPELAGKLGFFPIPGKTADRPGVVFTGGPDLIIPEASRNQVVKALAGERFQRVRHGQGVDLLPLVNEGDPDPRGSGFLLHRRSPAREDSLFEVLHQLHRRFTSLPARQRECSSRH